MKTRAVSIRARPERAVAAALLAAAGLPTDDLGEVDLERFFVAQSGGGATGLVGLELYGADALLRSLVVREQARGTGLGSALVAHVEDYARANGVRSIYLLTTTAADYFARRGYRTVDRALAPERIRATREFRDLCPASAVFMHKDLTARRDGRD